MRQESINVPIKGIMTDYAADAMPDNALSDCLNGTVITYNGNEMILQNDKGNIPLKGCTLNRDFMPVGTASYGDVLYIASYNPLTKVFELGSYPSPNNTITPPKEREIDSDTLLEKVYANEFEYTVAYDEMNTKYRRVETLYRDSENNDMIINPGDQYCIDEIPSTKYLYEALHFYILDSSNVLHDVTSYVKNDFSYNTVQNPEYKYVKWPYSGRLSYGWEIPGVNTFDGTVGIIMLPKIAIDKDGKKTLTSNEGSISLSFQINPSDNFDLWKDILENKDAHIKCTIHYKDNNGNTTYINETGEHEYLTVKNPDPVLIDRATVLGDSIYYYCNPIFSLKYADIIDLDQLGELEITAVPYCTLNDPKDNKKELVYDHLKWTQSIPLTGFDIEKVAIGTKLYQYTFIEENKYLSINVDAISGGIIASNLSIKMNLYNHHSELLRTYYINELSKTLTFEFENLTPGIYMAELVMIVDEIEESLWKKPVIASNAMNSFNDEDYSTITADRWVPEVAKVNLNVSIDEDSEQCISSVEPTPIVEIPEMLKQWYENGIVSPIDKKNIGVEVHTSIQEKDIYSYNSTHKFNRISSMFMETIGTNIESAWDFTAYTASKESTEELNVEFNSIADFKTVNTKTLGQPEEIKNLLHSPTVRSVYPFTWNMDIIKHKSSGDDTISFKVYAGDTSLSIEDNKTYFIDGTEAEGEWKASDAWFTEKFQGYIRKMLSANGNLPVTLRIRLITQAVNVNRNHLQIVYEGKTVVADKNTTVNILALAFLDNDNNIYLAMGDASTTGWRISAIDTLQYFNNKTNVYYPYLDTETSFIKDWNNYKNVSKIIKYNVYKAIYEDYDFITTGCERFKSHLKNMFTEFWGTNFEGVVNPITFEDTINHTFKSLYTDEFDRVELEYKNNTLANINKYTDDYLAEQETAYPCSVKPSLDHMIYNYKPSDTSRKLINLFENDNGWKVNGWSGSLKPVEISLVNGNCKITLGKSSEDMTLEKLVARS